MDIRNAIAHMTLKEKIAFCTGADFWHTKALPHLGVPSVLMSDGPHGIRCQTGQADMTGVHDSLPATCFPSAVTAGATWNPELYAAEGKAIGEEGLEAGVSVVLGPGCNIKRNPLGGRNFEYLSEDPYLSGKMAAAFIRGLQETGAMASLKHFAVNNQEYKRMNGDSQIDERTLREIYLTAFEIAIKESRPKTVMCAYNKINGVHCSDSRRLLTDILRGEWGFDGMVVTDWGAMNDRAEGFRAGCDLNMPGGSRYMEKACLEAVKNGTLREEDIDASVERILTLAQSAQKTHPVKVDYKRHHRLAQTVAEQGAVLLKNEDRILPLKDGSDVVLIGHMAQELRIQGSGSSHVTPTRLDQLFDFMPGAAYVECCDAMGNVTQEALAAAAQAAACHKTAVIIAGLPDSYESESFDREDMRLPDGHNRMIEAAAKANPDTVVVLLGGSPMELPWADQVKGILFMGLPGQAGGAAIARLLSGEAVPCGKLTESWPLSYEDVISKDTFGKKNVEYREGIYVGYRYYDKAKKAVRYPFGHGLSYTDFSYSSLTVNRGKVTVKITNTGSVAGAEVAQLYIAPPREGLHRPAKELKGFARVELAPGECKEVEFALDVRSFAVWEGTGDDPGRQAASCGWDPTCGWEPTCGWAVPGGTYQICVGSSSRDIRLKGDLEIRGKNVAAPTWQAGSWYETMKKSPSRAEWEAMLGHSVPKEAAPEKGQFTPDNTCLEMMDSSFVMKLQYKITELIVARNYGRKKDLSDPAYRMMLLCAADCPLRATVINSGGALTDSIADGLLCMANGHFLKGIAAMLKK